MATQRELYAIYVELLVNCGPDSVAATRWRDEHKDDTELDQLCSLAEATYRTMRSNQHGDK